MTERLLTLFGFVAIVELLGGLAIDQLGAPTGVLRVLHVAEMLLLIAFAYQRFHLRDRVPRLVLGGLLLSFVGDIIISFGLAPVFAIPSATAAHVCYATAFMTLILNNTLDRNPPLVWWRELAPWPFLALGIWVFVIDLQASLLLLLGSLLYAMAVTLMGLMAVLLGRRLKRYAWLPATGGVIFVVSDSLFAMYLLDGSEPLALSQLVWITYFLAQCLITHTAALPRRIVQYRPGSLAGIQ